MTAKAVFGDRHGIFGAVHAGSFASSVSFGAVFFGLILASGVLVGRMVQRWTLPTGLLVAAGFAFAFYLTRQAGTPLDPAAGPPYGYIFLCGVVGICAGRVTQRHSDTERR